MYARYAFLCLFSFRVWSNIVLSLSESERRKPFERNDDDNLLCMYATLALKLYLQELYFLHICVNTTNDTLFPY